MEDLFNPTQKLFKYVGRWLGFRWDLIFSCDVNPLSLVVYCLLLSKPILSHHEKAVACLNSMTACRFFYILLRQNLSLKHSALVGSSRQTLPLSHPKIW